MIKKKNGALPFYVIFNIDIHFFLFCNDVHLMYYLKLVKQRKKSYSWFVFDLKQKQTWNNENENDTNRRRRYVSACVFLVFSVLRCVCVCVRMRKWKRERVSEECHWFWFVTCHDSPFPLHMGHQCSGYACMTPCITGLHKTNSFFFYF